MGGRMIYTASATAKVDGKLVSIPKEIKSLERSMGNVKKVIGLFGKSKNLDEQDIELLESICTLADESEIFRQVLAEYIQKGTASWLKNSSFMSVPTPTVSSHFTELFKEVLSICSSTNASTVGGDVKTLVHIYADILEASNYKNAIEAVTKSDIMMNINKELRQNTHMNNVSVRGKLYDIVIVSIAAQMSLENPSLQNVEQYNVFMEGMTKSANTVFDNATLTRDQKISQLAIEADIHCRDMGFEFSGSVLSLLSEAMVDNFAGKDEPVSITEMVQFFGGAIINN